MKRTIRKLIQNSKMQLKYENLCNGSGLKLKLEPASVGIISDENERRFRSIKTAPKMMVG